MTATMPLPTSGVLDGKFHLFPIRVYYGETDAGQMVYHAAYLNFAERARTEMMRMAGIDHVSLFSDDGLMFTVHSADIRYLEQARLDDELVIRTHVVSSGGASMTISQHVFRIVQETMGDIIAEIDLRIALVDESGRPRRLPGQMKTLLDELRD